MTMNEKGLARFKERLSDRCQTLVRIIEDGMPDKGLKREDSQKLELLYNLSQFEMAVRGLLLEDFMEDI